jgi:hypothetical protein
MGYVTSNMVHGREVQLQDLVSKGYKELLQYIEAANVLEDASRVAAVESARAVFQSRYSVVHGFLGSLCAVQLHLFNLMSRGYLFDNEEYLYKTACCYARCELERTKSIGKDFFDIPDDTGVGRMPAIFAANMEVTETV